jgi:hypothetical protein
MGSIVMTALTRVVARFVTDERAEVNASMIAWMVVAVLVIFGFRAQLASMLSSAASFVMNTLGI